MSIKAIKSKKPEDMVLRLMRIAEILVKGEESTVLSSTNTQTLNEYIDAPSSSSEKHKHIVLM